MNEAVCDLCGGKLVRRGDDNEKTILNRIDVYLKETAPVIEYYRKASKLIEIDGAGTVSDVFLRLKEYLDDFVKN
jgi:adenylate kinase